MKILIQVGKLGSSIVDHRISPLAKAKDVTSVLVNSCRPGPVIDKVKYYCPPKFLTRFAPAAVVYQFFSLFYLALFRNPTHLVGFLLFPHGLIAFIVAKLTRKKVILFLIAGRAELYTKGSIQGIDLDNKIPPWYGQLYLKMLKFSDAIITTGSITKQFLVKHGMEADKIHPIINPANQLRFNKVNHLKIYDIVSVGLLSLIKHHEVLLYAISEVKKNIPGIKACIVGDGPRKPELMRLVNELGIKENVDFVGFQKDVSYYYNSAKIFIHTSEREGFPNVFLEAMQCGLPCIVSNCGDIIDIAKDGFNAIVIQKFNDFKGYAKAIITLSKDDKLYHKLSHNAIKTMDLLSVEDVTRKWESVLDYCK